MARVPYLDASDLAPDDQDLLKRPINLFRALVHSPGAARGWSTVGHYIRHSSKLDPRLREMAILQVGYVARAPYEWSHHVKIGHDFGVSDDDIRAIIAETEGHATTLDPFDKTVLKAAREMASGLAIADATFAALREKLDTVLLTDLVLTIAFYCAVVRVLATMQIDVEDDYLPYLKQFPLPKN
jgi:alkylhydroperoxidase family enzyme